MMMVLLWFAFALAAHALPSKVAANCAADYFKYCTAPVDSPEALTCLKTNEKTVSKSCAQALADETGANSSAPGTEVDETSKTTDLPAPVSTNDSSRTVDAVKLKVKEIVTKTKLRKKTPVEVKAPVKKKKPAVSKPRSKTKTKTNSRLQRGGKWDGYPLFLEWNDSGRRDYGSEITPYGFEDRQ